MGHIAYCNVPVHYSRKRKGIRTMVDGRTFYSKHMGVDKYGNRSASIFKNANNHWEVDYWLDGELVETVVMKTEYDDEVVFHNETYAENAAENYCLGYMK